MAQDLVAVTGAGGFIGRSTVRALQQRGLDISGLVGPDDPEPLPPPEGAGRWRWGSIDDPGTMTTLLTGCSSVIHLAGPPSVGQSFERPAEFVAAHTAGTATLIQAAARLGTVRRIVLVSSAEVYGVPVGERAREDDVPDPLSPYAAAKLGAEGVARVLARTHDLEVVAVRPFAVYGPASPVWSLVGTAVTQAMQAGSAPVLMNDLDRVRDFVYVDDVAELLVLAAVTPLPDAAGRCVPVNAATGRATSVLGLATSALAAVGRDAEIQERPARPLPSPDEILRGARPPWSDPLSLVGDPARAAELVGWTPRTDLDTGLGAVVAERRRTMS